MVGPGGLKHSREEPPIPGKMAPVGRVETIHPAHGAVGESRRHACVHAPEARHVPRVMAKTQLHIPKTRPHG
ncbi:hypothetical protein Afil01_16310 [Actinorhabdospora filicis]|uniref:Uncharacterized protein n=1 Tax=Actinorhabdospora filicis TaxID=1785913 RepID=A0A9W6SJN1_9ACTN|nr:hypothetical protein Afil01_16310 [Actinorhabdospora filicis]